MTTKAQIAAADIVFRAERGGWFVVSNPGGVAGVVVSSDERLRLIRESRARAKKYAIRIVNLREGEAAV